MYMDYFTPLEARPIIGCPHYEPKEKNMKYEVIIYDNTFDENKFVRLKLKDYGKLSDLLRIISDCEKPIKIIGEKDD